MCRRTLLFIVIVAVIVSLDERGREREREKERGRGEEKGEIVGTLFLQFYRITIEANFRNRSKIDWTTD